MTGTTKQATIRSTFHNRGERAFFPVTIAHFSLSQLTSSRHAAQSE